MSGDHDPCHSVIVLRQADTTTIIWPCLTSIFTTSTILTADGSRITEVCLEAAGLVSDPLNSVVKKIATRYISNSMFQCCRLIYSTSSLPVSLLCKVVSLFKSIKINDWHQLSIGGAPVVVRIMLQHSWLAVGSFLSQEPVRGFIW